MFNCAVAGRHSQVSTEVRSGNGRVQPLHRHVSRNIMHVSKHLNTIILNKLNKSLQHALTSINITTSKTLDMLKKS